LDGYQGISPLCKSSVQNTIPHSGEPGTQTSGGSGGFRGHCSTGGYNGTFGSGGLPGIGCVIVSSVKVIDGFSGSGGYYGSGGSAGGSSGHSDPFGSGGGSSFISGHSGCDAINESSTENNIIHTGFPWHYSGLEFSNTVMIDGSGKKWKHPNIFDASMPKPGLETNVFYPQGTGNGGSGFIRITILTYVPLTCNFNIYFNFISASLFTSILVKS
jgi:hypothetical protein